MKSVRPVRIVLALLLAVAASGCGDSPVKYGGVPAGRIQGTVRMAFTPVTAQVRFTLVPRSPGDAAQFETPVAPDGSYGMDLPAGRYVVGLILGSSVAYEFAGGGATAGDLPPDVLQVDTNHTPVTADFDLASVRVHLQASPALDGEDALIVLHRQEPPAGPGFRTEPFRRVVQIQNGAVDALVAGVLPGRYQVEVVLGVRYYLCFCPYDGEHVWMPGFRRPDPSMVVPVAAGQLAVVTGGVGTPARLQGRISGAWQDMGLGAPELSLFDADSTLVRGARRVLEDGSFDEHVYLPGPVKLLVTHDGVERWIGGDGFADATVYDLRAGETVSGIELVESGARVTLSVPASGIGGFVNLRFYDAGSLALAASWRANVAPPPAVIGVGNLRPGTYRLLVDFTSHGYGEWAPQWWDRVETPEQARTFTLARDGDVAPITVVMQTGGTISGTLRDDAGGDGDLVVYATRADAPVVWALRLESPGPYIVRGFANGRWKVGVWRRQDPLPEGPGLPAGIVWYPGTTDWQSAAAVPVTHLGAVTGIDLTMPAARR